MSVDVHQILPNVVHSMKIAKQSFYVTTPIYYVTAKPHLGSLYSTLIADVLARWNRLRGKSVFFLTGTDEHGQKIAQAADSAGKDPKEFVDSFIQSYKNVWAQYHIDYTRFIRTTDHYHVKAVQEWITRLQKTGDIYKSFYKGWYCTPDETFIMTVKEYDQKEEAPPCSSCGRATVWLEEETYKFRLSAYQDRLLAFYKNNPDFILPKERAQEVINFVESGLKDLSISRTTITWGIPFPNDNQHVTYVWADALNNYITAVGYLQPGREDEFNQWWPADIQVLGKDIIRFHAIYWPAFLMASGLALPKHLLVHGWLKVNQQKMSKSLGNTVDPLELSQAYGSDVVRYYLMRYMAITHDSDFSTHDIERVLSSDLANDLGNLLNRTLGLACKHNLTIVEPPASWSAECQALQSECRIMITQVAASMDSCMFHVALAAIGKYVSRANAFVHETQPWKIAKNDSKKFQEYISALCHSLAIVGKLLSPIMPKKMDELFQQLGIAHDDNHKDYVAIWITASWSRHFTLSSRGPLFVKIEPSTTSDIDKSADITTTPLVSLDDFIKIQVLVGQIKECHEVPKSEKLWRLLVDFGSQGIRQILSGIRLHYTSQQLIGRKALFVFNLAPRMMMGIESQGMILAAQRDDGTPSLVQVEDAVPLGARIR